MPTCLIRSATSGAVLKLVTLRSPALASLTCDFNHSCLSWCHSDSEALFYKQENLIKIKVITVLFLEEVWLFLLIIIFFFQKKVI